MGFEQRFSPHHLTADLPTLLTHLLEKTVSVSAVLNQASGSNYQCLPGCMHALNSVVVLHCDDSGQLLWANQGFWRLHSPSGSPQAALHDVRSFFALPNFMSLRDIHPQSPQQAVFEGLLTVADTHRTPHTLIGTVTHLAKGLLLIAEHDIAQLERLNAEVLALNDTLAQVQRDLAKANRQLQARETHLRELSNTDALTGVSNRRHLMERLDQIEQNARRYEHNFSVIMADIDHFKHINDQCGHAAGDQVLRSVAQEMVSTARNTDVVGRYGGEEFVIVLPQTDIGPAQEMAQRLRQRIAELAFDILPEGVRCSMGLALFQGRNDSSAAVLRRADQALYQAKTDGRDCVRVAPTA